MKLTEKTKRYLAVGGGSMICIALIAVISLQFGKTSSGEDVLPEETSAVTEIVVDSGIVQTEEATSRYRAGYKAGNGSDNRHHKGNRGNSSPRRQPPCADRPNGTEYPAGCDQTGSAK